MQPHDPASPDTPLSVPDAILRRRSVRHFATTPVPDELLERLLRLGVAAPSSWNLQPWRIVVVRDAERRARLAEACYGQAQAREAPVLLVFAISQGGWREHLEEVVSTAVAKGAWSAEYAATFRRIAPQAQEGLGERLREFNTKDALIAATHVALAAESVGLGSSFMNGYSESKVKAVIGAADEPDIGVALVLALGTPLERGRDPGRLPLGATVFDGELARPWPHA